jgi:hypothetical protein
MKIAPYVEKLHNSPTYREFEQKHKDAFLIAGFFVLDFEAGKHLHQIDYYVPSKKKVAAFTLDNKIVLQLLDMMDHKVPEHLDIKTNIDLDALKGIILDEMKNRGITQDIKKMIAVVQTQKSKKVWSVNCVLSGMDILKVHVEDDSQTILKMEKSSMFDYIKKMPGMAPQTADASSSPAESSKEDIEKKIQQLDKLKDALKQEESNMEKKAAMAKEKNSKPAKKKK